MEKLSEQKQEDSDVTFTSTGEELPLKELNQEPGDTSQAVLIEACEEDSVNCHRCHSSDIDRYYIDGHDVVHCICRQCWNEWVE